MKRFFIFVVSIVLILAIAGCGPGAAPAVQETTQALDEAQEIIVFAAASLTESFGELAGEFEKQEEGRVKVIFNFAGSQALETSVESGARADIFASASLKYMDMLKEKGFVNEYAVFAKNRLILIENNNSGFPVSNLGDLAADGIKIAVGDSSVPVGSYWEKALEEASKTGGVTADEKNAINGNIKTRELNVKDVVSKVVLNEADVGVVYRTDVTDPVAEKVKEIRIPDFEKFDAEYPAAVLKDAEGNSEARKFYDYLLSDTGREILKKYKFLVD
jgi:molybdate transport system substrate-binding protein